MSGEINPMDVVLTQLLVISNVTKMWHWKTTSFSQHVALGEMYDGLQDLTDELAEIYMGKYGNKGHIEMSQPNAFSETSVSDFINQVHNYLEMAHELIPQDGFLVNKFEELQALVARTKYKIDNLTEAKKETPYHLLPTHPGKVKKFEGRPVDFKAAVQRVHGNIKPKMGADKNQYFIKAGTVVARRDLVGNIGYVYGEDK